MKKHVIQLAALLVLSGCGAGMRWVRRAPTGGTIALKGDYDDAMDEARKAMRRHCNGPFTIVEEGEHVVGSTTTGVANSRNVGNVGRLTVGQSQTEQETEWRVQYACGVQMMQASAPPPPARPAE